jgi:2-methylcitrate dehydratase PrpD
MTIHRRVGRGGAPSDDMSAVTNDGFDLSQRIGEWAYAFEASAARLQRIKASLRDFIGCVVAGARRPELRPAMRLAQAGSVSVWGLTDTFDPAGAALLTGTAGALLQLQDVYRPGGSHPSSPIIPAAWSAMQVTGGVAAEGFLHAVAAGYETANRVADACMPGQLLAGSSPTGSAGCIGAAVAAAKIRGLDRHGIARAVSNAAFMLPATPFASMRAHGALAPLHGGFAARAGYEAASLARETHAGRYVLEGDSDGPGLIGLLGGNASALTPEKWSGETIDAVSWKFFPACFASHTAIEALLSLGRIDSTEVERVVVRRPAGLLDATVAAGPHEGGLYDRLMSIRWALARALELGHYEYPDAVADQPSTLALANKIDLVHDPALDALAPGMAAATIEVYVPRGVRRIDYRRALGSDPTTPRGWTAALDEKSLHAKFERLIGSGSTVLETCAELRLL